MPRTHLMPVADPLALSDIEDLYTSIREGLGDTVVPISHTAAVPGDLSGYDLVVFADSMQSNQIYKWNDVDIPILSLSLGKFLHQNQASQSFPSQGDSRLTRWIESTDASSSPTGLVTVYDETPATGYDYIPESALADEVVIVSRHQSGGDRITSILIPAGATLIDDNVCPSRRIVTPAEELLVATSTVWDILDDYIEWLAPEGPGPEPEDFILVDGLTGDPIEVLYYDGTQWS